jgi:hypothetical protein
MFLGVKLGVLGELAKVPSRFVGGFHVRNHELGRQLSLLDGSWSSRLHVGCRLELQWLIAARTTNHQCCAPCDENKTCSLHDLVSKNCV